MNINEERLIKVIEEIGNIGAQPENGITRLAYSEEYSQAVALLSRRMREAGLEVRTDGIGNLYGLRRGKSDNLPVILIGSHLDTVKNGGLYDGNLGVCAALELIRVMNENDVWTKHPIEIVAFTAEEGDTYGGTFGSRVITGLQDVDAAWLLERLKDNGITRQDMIDSKRDMSEICAFLELHIEQGGALEMKRRRIGIVSGIAGISRCHITVRGETNHAGTTPMALRKDALLATAKLINQIDIISRQIGDPFVSTVGVLSLKPGFINVIPGEVEMTLEMRDLEQSRIEDALGRIRQTASKIENAEIEIELAIEKPPVKTDERIIELMEYICRESAISYQVMPSGAGHDAKALAQFVPTGMLFIPSIGGKSHCKEEISTSNDIVLGTEVLLKTVLALDKVLVSDGGYIPVYL
ncbi:MAG: amidase, hydantoinase/carbamoylase family [Firmicutes bacterium]|nr:amidase, hydantoinase/carbamoylase family [Bacillota bacterium]